MNLDRRDFLRRAAIIATGGVVAAIGLKSCETQPDLVYSYYEYKGLISSVEIQDPKSQKNLRLSWTPNSDNNSVVIDREIYINPVEGNYNVILIIASSIDGKIPQNTKVQGTILQDKNLKPIRSLVNISSAWLELIKENSETEENTSNLVGKFVNKHGQEIKNALSGLR